MNSETVSHMKGSKEQVNKDTIKWYQSAVRSLMWAVIMMRPDLTCSMFLLSHYLSNSGKEHVSLLANVFCYVSGTLNLELTFSDNGSDKVIGYSDADFAGAVDNRKLTGGFTFMLAGECISRQSKQQSVVALLTCESEYMAMSEAGKEAMWIRWFLEELGYRKRHRPVRLNGDNQGAIALGKNPYDNRRLKHIHTRYHWIREAIRRRILDIQWIPTTQMAADSFTKALPTQSFTRFRNMIGLV